ncbi:MAG: hypothetical protein ACRDK7_14395 [Solirubrobacteraceae bacterium]
MIFGKREAAALRPARSAGHRVVRVLLASLATGSCLAGATASGAIASGPVTTSGTTPLPAPVSSRGLEATANPFGLPRVVRFRVKPATGVAITLGCTGTSTQPCTGTILATTAETLKDNKVVAITASSAKHAAKDKRREIRLAQTSFSLAGGQTKTIQLKLNSTGLKLLRRFHEISTYVLAGEVLPQGKFVFLLHEVLFKTHAPRK